MIKDQIKWIKETKPTEMFCAICKVRLENIYAT